MSSLQDRSRYITLESGGMEPSMAMPGFQGTLFTPPRPAVFGGTVSLDGAPAPDGTVVSAWIVCSDIGGLAYPGMGVTIC